MSESRRRGQLIVGGLAAGLVYGLVARVAMHHMAMLEIMSLAFVFVCPFVIGWIAGTRVSSFAGGWGRVGIALLSVTMFLIGTLVLMLEGLICVVMMAPVAWVMATLGALATLAPYRRPRPPNPGDHEDPPTPRKHHLAVLLLPLAVGLVEGRFELPWEVRHVHSRIDIDAPAARVWDEIVRVPTITEAERRSSWVHAMGFPHPLEATIDGEGVGATRHASFVGGILFEEVVTEWEPRSLLSFSIDVDAESIPTTTLDEHVVVGGRYFDTLEGTYRIEPHDSGGVTLHLSSRHRLSTPFNAYAGLWTDGIMAGIQEEILHVVRARAEGPEPR